MTTITAAEILDLTDAGKLVPIFLPTPRGLAICNVIKTNGELA